MMKNMKKNLPGFRRPSPATRNNKSKSTTSTTPSGSSSTCSNNQQEQHAIVWSAICRDKIILAEAGQDDFEGRVTQTAQALLAKKDTHGWEFYSHRGGHGSNLKGIKLHVYDKEELTGDLMVWKFAAVYNTDSGCTKDQVMSFLEKMVHITDIQRHDYFNWRYGSTLAAQESFAPILLQRMQEVAYMGRMAMMEENLDNAKDILHSNIEMALENDVKAEDMQESATHLEEAAKQFKKRARDVKRFRMWQNAKHGVVVGTLVTGVVAAVAVPPLIAAL